MSRIYSLSTHSSQVIAKLQTGQIPGLQHKAAPITGSGEKSLWPDGVTDGKADAWFEADMLVVWGAADESTILRLLKRAGIQSRYIG